MEQFNKAAIIGGLSAVVVGCGSESEVTNVGSQTWRLKHTEVYPYSVYSIAETPYAGDISVFYDENGEISSFDDYYTQPTYTAVKFEDGVVVSEESITKEQVSDYQNQPNITVVISHSEQPCLEAGDVYASSEIRHGAADSWGVTTTLTHYPVDLVTSGASISGGHALTCDDDNNANESCTFISGQIQEPEANSLECSEPVTRTSTVDFIDWGDNTYIWGTISDEWADTGNSSFADDFTFEDSVEVLENADDFLFPVIGDGGSSNLSPEIEEPVVPSIETIREYDSVGKLTRITYPSTFSLEGADTVDISKSITLMWQGQSLKKTTTATTGLVTIANPGTGVSQDIYFGPNSEYRYDYSEFDYGIVKATVLIERDETMQELITLRATYEKADCGPMTMERSKKYVPQPFPVCFER